MVKAIQWVGCCLLLTGLALPLHAGVFGTAATLRPGHFSLGLEPAFTFSPTNFSFNIHGGIGLVRNIDLDLKLGLSSNIYFGADVEFNLLPDTSSAPGISAIFGGHGTSHFGLDGTLLISKQFNTFSLYGALDADFEFYSTDDNESGMVVPLYFDIGVAIPIARRMEFLLEGNIGLTSAAASGLSGGVAFYF